MNEKNTTTVPTPASRLGRSIHRAHMGFHTPPLRTVNPIHTMLNTTTARPRARARLATDDAPFDRVPPPPAHTHARAPAPQHMSTIFTTSLSAKASAKVRLAPRASSRAIHPTDGRDRDIRSRVYAFASRDVARRPTTRTTFER